MKSAIIKTTSTFLYEFSSAPKTNVVSAPRCLMESVSTKKLNRTYYFRT